MSGSVPDDVVRHITSIGYGSEDCHTILRDTVLVSKTWSALSHESVTETYMNRDDSVHMQSLRQFPQLRKLRIDCYNAVSDVSILGTLPALRELTLDVDYTVDISSIASLTMLQKLDIKIGVYHDNEDEDEDAYPDDGINWISSLTDLTHLRISSSSQLDISPLSHLVNLTHLKLPCIGEDISPFVVSDQA